MAWAFVLFSFEELLFFGKIVVFLHNSSLSHDGVWLWIEIWVHKFVWSIGKICSSLFFWTFPFSHPPFLPYIFLDNLIKWYPVTKMLWGIVNALEQWMIQLPPNLLSFSCEHKNLSFWSWLHYKFGHPLCLMWWKAELGWNFRFKLSPELTQYWNL